MRRAWALVLLVAVASVAGGEPEQVKQAQQEQQAALDAFSRKESAATVLAKYLQVIGIVQPGARLEPPPVAHV